MLQTATIGHCWRLRIAAERPEEEIRFLDAYFESKKELPGFPFVIFADHLPDEHELEEIRANAGHLPEQKFFFLALTCSQPGAITAYWHMLSLGLEDVIEWTTPLEITGFLESWYARKKMIDEAIRSPLVSDRLVGQSEAWKKFLSGIVETTLFSDTPILLTGESGTGKELVAHLVHDLNNKTDKKKPTIVDCTTIVPELSGSELFGHERGSYTNAIQSREGAFALASGGTLFLDEIGELPLHLQAELLRVLQEGTYKKVGSNLWQKTKFRLVCATHRNLPQAVEEGRFRQDLYFRISDNRFHVPALEERREDIPLLAKHFLTNLFEGRACPEIDRPVIDYLVKRKYPGNIRELKQVVHRMALKHTEHKKITVGEVPAEDRILLPGASDTGVRTNGIHSYIRNALLTGETWWNLKSGLSETAIEVALGLENNNKQKAAERLGVDVRTVQQYVKKKG